MVCFLRFLFVGGWASLCLVVVRGEEGKQRLMCLGFSLTVGAGQYNAILFPTRETARVRVCVCVVLSWVRSYVRSRGEDNNINGENH